MKLKRSSAPRNHRPEVAEVLRATQPLLVRRVRRLVARPVGEQAPALTERYVGGDFDPFRRARARRLQVARELRQIEEDFVLDLLIEIRHLEPPPRPRCTRRRRRSPGSPLRRARSLPPAAARTDPMLYAISYRLGARKPVPTLARYFSSRSLPEILDVRETQARSSCASRNRRCRRSARRATRTRCLRREP